MCVDLKTVRPHEKNKKKGGGTASNTGGLASTLDPMKGRCNHNTISVLADPFPPTPSISIEITIEGQKRKWNLI